MSYTEKKKIFEDPESFDKKTVEISGWIRSIRSSNAFGFLVLSDGSFFKPIQIVFDSNLSNYSEITKFSNGSSVKATGEIVLTPDAPQPFEMHAIQIDEVAEAAPDYPLQKKRTSFDNLRMMTHLRPRTNTFQAVFRVRSVLAYAIHKFFQDKNFVYVTTPLITASDAEGAGEMFRVTTMDPSKTPFDQDGKVDYSQDFFGRQTNLTVSGQLYGECFATAFRNIYTFGPTFRAENSNTTRHLAEFWMIEPEIAFADLTDDMDLAEEMIKYIIKYTQEHASEEMEFFNKMIDKDLEKRLESVTANTFERISYTEAVKILEKHNDEFSYKVEWGTDLQTEHERYLTEKIFGKPVFVTDYPKDIKAFYMKQNPDGKTVSAADCLVPGIGEIIGGSAREDDIDILQTRMMELGMNVNEYKYYLDLRKYGSCPHAGYGLGFERFVMYITGMQNIRDVIPFPRTAGNCIL